MTPHGAVAGHSMGHTDEVERAVADALLRIRALFKLEEDWASLAPKQRHERRQRVSRPMLDDFFAWKLAFMVRIRRELSLTIRADSSLRLYRIGKSRSLLLVVPSIAYCSANADACMVLRSVGCRSVMSLGVHSDGPDEAQKLAPNSSDDLLVWKPTLGESAIAAMKTMLSLPGDVFHGFFEILVSPT